MSDKNRDDVTVVIASAPAFAIELERAINRCCQENCSDTPDFILAQYLLGCLAAFNDAVKRREKWYGREADALALLAALPPNGEVSDE